MALIPWMLWALGIAVFAAGGVVVLRALFSDRSRGRRRCPGCWYDMRDTPGLLCPECGREARAERRLFRTRRHPRRVLIGLSLGALGVFTFVMPAVMARGWTAVLPTPVLPYVAHYFKSEVAAEYGRCSASLRMASRRLTTRQRMLVAAHMRNLLVGAIDGPPTAWSPRVPAPPLPLMGGEFDILAYLGRDGATAAPIVRRVLSDGLLTSGDRIFAVQAILTIDTPDRAWAALAAAAEHDGDPQVRYVALGAVLHDLANQPGTADLLPRMLEDPDPIVRLRAAYGLQRCQPHSPTALAALTRHADNDTDRAVRDKCREAMIHPSAAETARGKS